ncbi:PhzF family phenazine biosynthesis protein [Rhodohalobacter sp. 614A]|uniref:PhzF family phenazine biosynthesis protein n=1 Tax=Rhodohalobacter sp. 614A TaxID=2908649 RepID=UPI001F47A204|nr:PhzF family phenazine biosynthesis protein [Rhodohalobacter sp. 614A]
MKLYQVDAFTDEVFSGNPAAVIPLEEWLDADAMQNIAAENNLSETAYFVKEPDGTFTIRWFTPKTEVDICGHATLASAHVLFEHLDFDGEKVVFQSKSGELTVEKREDIYWMNFPATPPEPIPVPKLLPDAIGTIPIFTGVNRDMIVLLHDEETVQTLKPDYGLLERMEVRGIVVTAEGNDCDFVSRYFAPSMGIYEDPVTGSAHTLLAPFWGKRLGKSSLNARQISKRGGNIQCNQKGDRVEIGGSAVTYMIGEINI